MGKSSAVPAMVKKKEHNAEHFLALLEQRVQDLLAVSRLPEESANEINFDDYSKFRDMMAECLSFLIIIERRIEQQSDGRKERLQEQFDTLTVAIWSILLDGSLGFLTVICERDYLPLGTRHVFVQELKTLYDAERVLKEGKYQKHLIASAIEQRNKAELILNEIIDRAPQLLNFG